LLFAWHFNGDVAALKRWCSDAKGALGNLAHQGRAQRRKELAAVMKCQNEHVLAMAAHAMSAHFSVDIPALCVENYMKMHAQGKVLKPDAYSRLKPRMTAGDAAHFAALITAVENLTTEQRNRMAGSEDKMPTPPRPRAGGYKKKQLSYEQLEELSASNKSERDAEIASRRKADTRHAEKVKAVPDLAVRAINMEFGPSAYTADKLRHCIRAFSQLVNAWNYASAEQIRMAGCDGTSINQNGVLAFISWDDLPKSKPLVLREPVRQLGGKAEQDVELIQTLVFDFSRQLLADFKQMCSTRLGVEAIEEAFPPLKNLSARFRAFIGDNCPTQLKVGRLIRAMAEQAHIDLGGDPALFVFFLLHCWQHIRNTIALHGAKAEERELSSVLSADIAALPTQSRITCKIQSLYLSVWKAFGAGGEYAKGYTEGDFMPFLVMKFNAHALWSLKRPMGQRFDGLIEMAPPLWHMLPAYVAFCKHVCEKVNTKKETKILLECILKLLTNAHIIAAVRCRAILWIKVFWPLRFLVASHEAKISNADMGGVVELLEKHLEIGAANGEHFLDAGIDVFGGIKNAALTKHTESVLLQKKKALNGSTHYVWAEVEASLFAPEPGREQDLRAQGTDAITASLISVWCQAMLDSILEAESRHWSQRCAGKYSGSTDDSKQTLVSMRGAIDDRTLATKVNDVAESLLGATKQAMVGNPRMLLETAGGLAAAKVSGILDEGGWVDKVDPRIRDLALEFSYARVPKMRGNEAKRHAKVKAARIATANKNLDAALTKLAELTDKAEYYFNLDRIAQVSALRMELGGLVESRKRKILAD
jgi:hypothetical protein